MKKIYSVLALALAMVGTMSAQTVTEHTNNLNPYAYGVSTQARNGKIAVAYQLNTAATATEIVIYKDGVEVGTQTVEELAAGLHNVVVDLASYTEAGTYTVGIRVHGVERTAPEQLVNVTESGDSLATNYTFWHARGLAIDNNPYSENFGRIITGESQNDTPPAGYWQSGEGQGIVAFDASFSPIPNGNSRTYKMGLDMTQNKAPFRMIISDDSRIFVSTRAENLELVYEVSADLQTATPLIAGALLNDKKAQNVSLDLRRDGEDLVLLTTNTTSDGNGANGYDNVYEVAEYNLAGAEPVKTLPFGETTLKSIVDANGFTTTLTDFMEVKYDGNGGYWYANSRSNDTECKLAHITAEGVADYQSGTGFYGGGGLCVVGDKLYVGMDRYSSTNGHIGQFTIGHDAEGNITLTQDFDIKALGIGRNINAIAIDYANNLYAVGNSNEKLVAIMLPTNGIVETPTTAEVVVEPQTAIENVEAVAPVQKVIENGQVIIIKNGVRYNAVGARL